MKSLGRHFVKEIFLDNVIDQPFAFFFRHLTKNSNIDQNTIFARRESDAKSTILFYIINSPFTLRQTELIFLCSVVVFDGFVFNFFSIFQLAHYT